MKEIARCHRLIASARADLAKAAGALSITLSLVGCHEKPVSVSSTNNPNMNVALLFTHDGCKVYRFIDSEAHYFVRCDSGSSVAIGGHYRDPCQDGKGNSCPQVDYEDIPTETVPVRRAAK